MRNKFVLEKEAGEEVIERKVRLHEDKSREDK